MRFTVYAYYDLRCASYGVIDDRCDNAANGISEEYQIYIDTDTLLCRTANNVELAVVE